MQGGGIGWVMAVNLVIWTGLIVYVGYLDKKVRNLKNTERSDE